MPEGDKFITKKSLGQHFLNSEVVPSWMCDAAEITNNDNVLEIGPGTGALTKELLKRGAKVTALEADERAIASLQTTFAEEISAGQLLCIHMDVRGLEVSEIPGINDHDFKIVANIPYYLSGMLFRTFLESSIQPNTLVYLVQKEVAKRITTSISKGEKESLLSLSIKAYGTPKYVRTVSRGHFTPPPKVDSAIIAIKNINRDHFKVLSETDFFTLLHLGFGQKRKQLLGNLSGTYDRETVTHILSTVGLPESVRAEDIPLEKWLIMAEKLLST